MKLIDKNKRKKKFNEPKKREPRHRFGSGSLTHLGLKKPKRAGLSTNALALGLSFFFLRKKSF